MAPGAAQLHRARANYHVVRVADHRPAPMTIGVASVPGASASVSSDRSPVMRESQPGALARERRAIRRPGVITPLRGESASRNWCATRAHRISPGRGRGVAQPHSGAARVSRNELALARKVRERFPETPKSHVNADPIEPLTATLGPMSLMQSRVSRDESVASRGYV
jgi:hypothetical protein